MTKNKIGINFNKSSFDFQGNMKRHLIYYSVFIFDTLNHNKFMLTYKFKATRQYKMVNKQNINPFNSRIDIDITLKSTHIHVVLH